VAHDRPHRRLEQGGEARQHGGVDGVGPPGPAAGRPEDKLGLSADRLGEAPRLAGD
jgi:hypothetical protein